jgi:Bacterial Ig domain
LTVTSVNEAPVAQGQSESTQEDTAKALVLAASDGDGDPLTYTIVSPPAHGTLSGAGANRTYTPAANYSGADSFTFQVNDGTADSNVATVSLTVDPVNDAPSCPAQVLTVDEDTPGSKTPVCTDAEGQAITLQIVEQPAEGTAEVVGGELRFVPVPDVNGGDSFTYRGTDGALAGPAATVSVTVVPANDVPTCNPVTLTTQVNVAGSAPTACADVDGDSLTYEILTQPTHGTASVNLNELSYSPATDYTGTDTFTYRAWDGTVFSAAADVAVTVTTP